MASYIVAFCRKTVIQCGNIVRLWIAEGFVEQVRGAKLEGIANSYIAELSGRFILQVVRREPSGRIKQFKMPLRSITRTCPFNFRS
ncbi:hypothetical protein RchiOBHm_Chr5g0006081 [Rosa chinensis]|uniref:Disease resistance protein winged helix domain-containing protein n=1 Tax=Rosa chinensis TaxID=74649 RepID=A0A2P6Q3H3_ROSCH|nr:hypothetical protein RchiOBHm_Chr5g0006081 [Rosa chinensis]